jgi:hypothetical protein
MNEAPVTRNRRTVRNSRLTSALGLSLALLAGGCAAAPTVLATLDGLPEGTTTLRISNHVAAPGQLERLVVSVDGETLPLSSIPPEGGALATLGTLRLTPGSHSIAVRAKAHAPGSDVIVVGAQQPFQVRRGPAAITIDVRSGGGSEGNDVTAAPVAVTLTILGGHMAPDIGVAPPDERDQRCAALLPIPRALCRAAVDLDEATRHNDIVAALCVRDKLVEMRKLAIIGESGRGDSVALAEAQVALLSRQVERCALDIVASPVPDGLTVTRPGGQPGGTTVPRAEP